MSVKKEDLGRGRDLAEVAEELFDHWNDRSEDDSNNEGVEDDDGKNDKDEGLVEK